MLKHTHKSNKYVAYINHYTKDIIKSTDFKYQRVNLMQLSLGWTFYTFTFCKWEGAYPNLLEASFALFLTILDKHSILSFVIDEIWPAILTEAITLPV